MTRSPLHHPSWLPLMLVALLAALTTWLGRLAELPVQTRPASVSQEPDYVVERFQATAYDPQGHPRYRLAAESMQHHANETGTRLERPAFTYDHPDQPPLHARAERGTVSADGEHIQLRDAVRVEQVGQAARPPIVLSTARLDIRPEARTLATDAPVRIEQGASHTIAGGLRADASLGILHLSGGVKSHYETRR